MKAWLSEIWFKVRFFLLTRGTTEKWLHRVWAQLIDHDIHPDDDQELITPDGRKVFVSAFGSQLWVRWPKRHGDYQFTINWSAASGLYVHEKHGNTGGDGDWLLAYKEKFPRVLISGRWASSMKLLAANMGAIDDRSAQNTVDYRGAT